jgi:hypothetical protein
VAGDPETNSSVKATPAFPDRIVGGCVAGWCHCHREGGEVGEEAAAAGVRVRPPCRPEETTRGGHGG